MKTAFIIFLLVIVLAARIYLHFSKPPDFKEQDMIRITKVIRSEPIRYETSQYLKIKGLKVYLPLYPEVAYGDSVVIEGTVEGDRLRNPNLISVGETQNLLFKFRKSLTDFYKKALPEPHASLVAGVTIGSKSGIPEDFWDVLKSSGTAHVVVASGMNVSLVGQFLIQFFAIFLKRRRALIFALSGVWLYAVLSGFDAPIVRAAVMGSIAFSAQELGKLNFSIRALLISVSLMLFLSPAYIEDLGFWLSFLATLSIILLEPKVKKFLLRLKFLREDNFIQRTMVTDLSTTLSAQTGVVPLLYYFFGQFSLLSPVANVLVLWTIVPITLIGMVGGIIGTIFEPIGTLILWFAYPLTVWFTNVVKLFGA